MNTKTIKGTLLAFLAVAGLVGEQEAGLHAAQIQGVTINSSSAGYFTPANSANANTDRRSSTNLVLSTGLFGDMHTFSIGDFWLSSGSSANPGTNFVTFDLGATHTVNAMKVWNYNENNANTNTDVFSAAIAYSADGVNFTTNISNPGVSTNYLFNQAPGAFSNFSQTISANMGFSARYVRIDVVTNWSKTAANFVGLAKVRFVDNSVPPTVLAAGENYGRNQVTVQFSESVDPASGTNPANYAITTSGTNSATILSAAMGEFNDRIILHTTPLTNSSYSLAAAGVYDEALTTPITNTTIAVQPELIVWLKADTGVLTDSSGNVTNWDDQSGYGNNAGPATNPVTASAINPPSVISDVVNGEPAISFAGNNTLQIPNSPNLAIHGDATIILVLNNYSTTAIGDPIAKTGGADTSSFSNNMPAPFDLQLTAAGKIDFIWGDPNGGGSQSKSYTGNGAMAAGSFYILSAVVNGTNVASYINGAFNGSTFESYAPADDGHPMRLGVRLDNFYKFDGYLAEAMVIRGTITPADLSAIHGYLGAKYGIPIVSLGINEQPQSVTAQVGRTATFWVDATGVPPVSYQWRTNSAGGPTNNIIGATNAVYTTPSLTLAPYNGLLYSVAVTTPVGSTNSAPATLTVVNNTTPPAIFSATKTAGGTNVVVMFSEAVGGATALNPANYALSPGVSLLSANYGSSSSNSVILLTSALNPNAAYSLTVQNVQDLAGNTMTNATLPVLPASLSFYLRGDSGVILDDSGLVDQWLDQTTNGNNAVQFVGGPVPRPTTGDTINSVPVVRFTSANSTYLQAASSASLAITGDMTIYAVANIFDFSGYREFLGKTAANEPGPYDFYAQQTTGRETLLRGNGASNGSVVSTAALSADIPHVFSVTMQATNVSHFLDGLANGTGILNTAIADAGTPLDIGTRNLKDIFMNGDMGEIMIFNGALSGSDRTNVDNYLGQKYFPFNITQEPLNVTTPGGVSAIFTVAASQGSAHFNYQWQENSTNIPGATNASYTTPMLTDGDNGEVFEVAVIVPGYSTNFSSPATLTVNNILPALSLPAPYTNLFTLYAGANPTFSVSAPGAPASFSYHWFTNGVLDGAAITNSLPMTNVQIGTFSNYCIVTNIYGAGTSMVWEAQVIADPTNFAGGPAPYPQSVLALNPVGYWRLNDINLDGQDDGNGDDGYVANDYAGGYDGIYTNVSIGQAGYNPTADPSDSSTQFGEESGSDFGDSLAGSISGIDFSSPANTSVAFTVEAWVSGYPQSYDAGIASVGYGGSEQFDLDTGADSGSPTHAFRFFFRDASGQTHGVSSAVAPSILGAWYHLAAVVDEITNDDVAFYINGALVGTTPISPGIGVLAATTPMNIGSRMSGPATNFNDQFLGNINDVAVFNYALSSNQVVNQYRMSGIAPVFSQEPVAGTNVSQGGTLSVSTAANGTAPLSYEWFDEHANSYLVGQTNATLVVSNVQNSDTYYLTVNNLYGSTNSSPVLVNVISGLSVTLGPPGVTLYTGQSATLNAQSSGTVPFYYQWYQGLSPIAGATNASYAAVAASGAVSYSCTVSNAFNGYSSTNAGPVAVIGVAAPATLYQLTVLSNNPTAYWRLNEGPDNGSGNNGTIAYDYVHGHNGAYTNVQLGAAGLQTQDNTDTAAFFGPFNNVGAATNSYVAEIFSNGMTPIDFSTPNGGNAEFSVEAWINSTNNAGGCIITKGYGHGEQFDLDLLGAQLRFFVRNAAGTAFIAQSAVAPVVGQWYHLVGVCDESNGLLHLYINGLDNADAAMTPGSGLLSLAGNNPTLPQTLFVSIGARASTETTNVYDLQFQGRINDVAVYNYALSASQVAADYAAAGIPPAINSNPTNIVFTTANNQLALSWPADHTGWQLQAQTNSLLVGLSSNWVNVSGSAGTNRVIIPINLTNGSVFYRLIYNP